MSGKFRSGLSGFNRQDVITYIKKILDQRGELSAKNEELTAQMEDLCEDMDALKDINCELTGRLCASAAELTKVQSELDSCKASLAMSQCESETLKSGARDNINNVLDILNESCDTTISEVSRAVREIRLQLERLEQVDSPMRDALDLAKDRLSATETPAKLPSTDELDTESTNEDVILNVLSSDIDLEFDADILDDITDDTFTLDTFTRGE